MRKITIKNKKGSVLAPILLIIVAFVTVTFLALWNYGNNLLTDTLIAIDTGNADFNISNASIATFGQLRSTENTWLPILAYAIIFSMVLLAIFGNVFEGAQPAFLIVFILVTIVAVIASVYISNYYEELLQDPVLGSSLRNFRGGSFVLLNLPIWVTVVGFLGAIFMFIGILRDRSFGGGVV